MQCFEICYGHPPFRICYKICLPQVFPYRWPHFRPDPPPEIDTFGDLTINGENPEWLGDVHALALALRGAEIAKGEVATILNEAVERATHHIRQQIPAEIALSRHDHAQAAPA